ncbi:Hypothetical predicted protein [Pelobates cultripes]|uniref:Uncharacterized protein n=1 Tax=Pelobates cultripes TaxID=61616 RepID=A0AAD1R6W6_PELCU|nr:Hypothetical predicted protein [Pelobates cultripes]
MAGSWKRASALEDWSDSDPSEEEVSDGHDYASNDEARPKAEESFDLGVQEGLTSAATVTAPEEAGACLWYPQGHLFDPYDLRNPRSVKWKPPTHITNYLALRMRTPLRRGTKNFELNAPILSCPMRHVEPRK